MIDIIGHNPLTPSLLLEHKKNEEANLVTKFILCIEETAVKTAAYVIRADGRVHHRMVVDLSHFLPQWVLDKVSEYFKSHGWDEVIIKNGSNNRYTVWLSASTEE